MKNKLNQLDYLLLNSKWHLNKSLCTKKYKEILIKKTTTSPDGYSLSGFYKTESIFIHIPKCAGISVCNAIYGNKASGHTTFSRIIDTLEPKAINEYFKFTITRNPWDRLASAYFFLKDGGMNQKDKDWAEKNLSEFLSFEDFVCKWVTKENINSYLHFKPQHHYILDRKNRIDLDFIGSVENIEKDIEYISEKIRMEIKIGHKNKSNRNHYTDLYNQKTINIVREVYKEDINLLGYQYGD